MKIAFRVDSSERIGTGHVMRCLTLAQCLRARGAEMLFVCRRLAGHILSEVERRGFAVHVLPPPSADGRTASWLEVPLERDARETVQVVAGCDWLVVDHYEIGADWEDELRGSADAIMVIDDLANRGHECALLLDQGYYEAGEERYRGLLPDDCVTLLGPRYALLRDEFEQLKPRERDGTVRRVLISFGGVDRSNETLKCLQALERSGVEDVNVTAVAGPANPHWDELEHWCRGRRWVELVRRTDDMAQRMHEADLALGAGGTTTLERLSLGLPAITVALADNQRGTLEALHAAGALWHLGWHDDVGVDDIVALLAQLRRTPERPARAGERALALARPDGQGRPSGKELVADALLGKATL